MTSSLLAELQPSLPNALIEVSGNLKPQYEWNERFRCEKERLKTFQNWPLEWLDKQTLATSGMFYTGINDNTKCYFCDVIIGKWERNDDPVLEHLRWSQYCPLLQWRTTDNIPLSAKTLELVLPPSKQLCHDTPPSTTSKPITFRDYSIKAVRLLSFANWPKCLKQKPHVLAEAGLYYTGNGDCVVCFSCLAHLKDWEEDDDPWEQHAMWMGDCCPYVRLVKGEEYVKSVNEKFKKGQAKKVVPESKQNTLVPKLVTSSESNDMKLCKICFDKEYNTVYVPCGHVVACSECALTLKECPVCRAAITNVVRLYFS